MKYKESGGLQDSHSTVTGISERIFTVWQSNEDLSVLHTRENKYKALWNQLMILFLRKEGNQNEILQYYPLGLGCRSLRFDCLCFFCNGLFIMGSNSPMNYISLPEVTSPSILDQSFEKHSWSRPKEGPEWSSFMTLFLNFLVSK